MELDQKIRYALLAFSAASLILAAHGMHAGLHLRALEGGGRAD